MAEHVSAKARPLLDSWLGNRLSPDSLQWLQQGYSAATAKSRQAFFLAFGMVPRKTGKADLALSADELAAAAALRPGWNPAGWSIDQAARTRLVLAVPEGNVSDYLETLDKLFNASDMGELVALYQALPLLPYPESHRLRAAEGIRSNIKAVFCAVAHGSLSVTINSTPLVSQPAPFSRGETVSRDKADITIRQEPSGS